MPDDLETSSSTSQAGDNDDGEKSSKNVDYAAKYRGEAKRAAKLQKDNEILQNQYDEALIKANEAESKVRTSGKDAEKQLGDLKTQVADYEKKHQDTIKKLSKYEAMIEARKVIRKDFAPLMDMLDEGDLRLQDEFDTPEEYQAYLKRMLARIVKEAEQEDKPDEEQTEQPENDEIPTPEQLQLKKYSGTTPRVPTSNRDGKNIRTVAQITNEMWELDTTKPEGKKKYAALEKEMNQALLNEGIRVTR